MLSRFQVHPPAELQTHKTTDEQELPSKRQVRETSFYDSKQNFIICLIQVQHYFILMGNP